MQQHELGEVGEVYTVTCAVHFWIQQGKLRCNSLIFQKVTDKNKLAPFFLTQGVVFAFLLHAARGECGTGYLLPAESRGISPEFFKTEV